jgi:hypothetical protein
LLVDLVGFTSSGLSHTDRVGFRENLPERLDRLIGERRMPPVVVPFSDCFTRLATTNTSTQFPSVFGRTFCSTICASEARCLSRLNQASRGGGSPEPKRLSAPPLIDVPTWNGESQRSGGRACSKR